MKVLALGGAGNMGQVAVRTILESKEVERLIVADRDIDRATGFVQSLCDKRVTARSVDIEDTPALERLMSKADIVMNTVGPFYRTALPTIRAAIKTRRHYVDIMDDYESAEQALKLDEEAKRAGVTVLIGMGSSPGLTNILARHAASKLDEVDYIQTVWGHVGGVQRPRSALVKDREALLGARVAVIWYHYIYGASFPIPVFRDGKFVKVIPLEAGEEVTFRNGKGFFWYYGHGEQVTLPRFIKGLKGACNLMNDAPEHVAVLRELGAKVRAKQLTVEEAAAMFGPMLYLKRLERPDYPVDLGPRVGGLISTAAGKRGRKRVRYGYGFTGAPAGGMAGITGIPLAVGTDMIMTGEISQRGVVAPEACIDPLPFIKRYMKDWTNPPGTVGQALYEVIEEM
jgi:saccharopine dehydrogenase-like NADP-dependent oxidoreductase